MIEALQNSASRIRQTEPAQAAISAPSTTRPTLRFLSTPVDLILAYRERPEVIGVFDAIIRLCEVERGPVEVSRADLARWCDAGREDALGGAIERAIWDLRRDGWLIQTTGRGRKRRLQPGWGVGSAGRTRPWRFDRRDRGRPSNMAIKAVPLDLLDNYLGRLRTDPYDAAIVERYFDRPLLTYADIGVYAARLLGSVPPTSRLVQLGLIDDTGVILPAGLGDLLNAAATGCLTSCNDDETVVSIGLSPQGRARLQKCRTAQASVSLDARDGSAADPAHQLDGSADGSGDTGPYFAPRSEKTPRNQCQNSAWDSDGNNQKTNHDPTTNRPPRARTGGGVSHTGQCSVPESLGSVTATAPDQSGQNVGACEKNHSIQDLDPDVMTEHRALNLQRIIPPGEWLDLLDLQERFGAARLLRWQGRARNTPGRDSERGIIPAYYEKCAAQEAADTAFAAHRQRSRAGRSRTRTRSPETSSGAPPDQDAESSAQALADQNGSTAERKRRPAALHPTLNAEQTVAVAALEAAARIVTDDWRVRAPWKLVDTSLDVLAAWTHKIGHPGLQAFCRKGVINFAVDQAALNLMPPSDQQLERWKQQAPGYNPWEDPAFLSTVKADNNDADNLAAEGPRSELYGEWAEQHLLAHLPRPTGTSPGVQPDSCSDLFVLLREALPRRWWPLLEHLHVSVADATTTIICDDLALWELVWDIQGVVRDTLIDLGLPDNLQISMSTEPAVETESTCSVDRDTPVSVAGPVAATHESSVDCPGWISTATWATLSTAMRAALAGSELCDGEVRTATVGQARMLDRCFKDRMADLIACAAHVDNAALQ